MQILFSYQIINHKGAKDLTLKGGDACCRDSAISALTVGEQYTHLDQLSPIILIRIKSVRINSWCKIEQSVKSGTVKKKKKADQISVFVQFYSLPFLSCFK